ncbi:MAG: hypothetical protein NT039_00650 [Candidatus Berkelbacteria bacterium]|nr:hypothetical protein [Candidatus Berkelbacteria bacterium]
MDQETEQTPEAGDPVQEAGSIYQEYVDFWQKDPPSTRISGRQGLIAATKSRGPENQSETAKSLAEDSAGNGFSQPVVLFLELTDLSEKDKWSILARSLEKEVQKSTESIERQKSEETFAGPDGKEMTSEPDKEVAQNNEAEVVKLRQKAETMRKGIAALG